MVVMEDGLPKRSDYRRFKVKTLDNQDDFASMEEVLTRRFRNYLRERDEGAHTGKRFAYPPNLLVIDGGKGQLGVAVRVLEELGLEDICAAGLAKRFEEVFLPGQRDPVRIPRDSEALYLLQQVRDEAHRFAITYHRQLRGKKMTQSILDGVPGLGPGRKQRLLREVGSVKRLRALSEDEILDRSWLPDAVGKAVYARLHDLQPAERARPVSVARPWMPNPWIRHRWIPHPWITTHDRRPDARRHDHHRHVRCRSLRGRGRARRPGLLRDRQPPPDADRQGRRAGAGPRDADPLRARGRRALRRLPARPLDRGRRAAPPGRDDAHPLSRRGRRSARASIRGEPAPASDVRFRPRLRRHRRRARAARAVGGGGRPARRHVDPQRARAARSPRASCSRRRGATRRSRSTS